MAFTYEIKTTAELSGMDAALAKMERENAMALAMGKAQKYATEQIEGTRAAIAKYRAEVAEAVKAEQAAEAATKAAADAKAKAAADALEAAKKANPIRVGPVRVEPGPEAGQLDWSRRGASQASARAQAEAEERARLAEQAAWAQKNTAIRVQPPKKPGELYDLDAERARTQSQLQFNVRQSAAKNQGSGIGAWLSGVNKELVDIVPGLARVEMMATKLVSGPMAGIAAGFTLAAGAIMGAKKALHEFAQTEAEMARLDAQLANIGQLTDANREKIIGLAQAMQSSTGIADEQWLRVARSLLQFSKNAASLPQDIEAVKNFAAVTGDLDSATTAIGKAMQGEFDILRRYGVSIADTASHAEKLAMAYREIAIRGGGQFEARLKTITGRLEDTKNKFNDIFKSVGQWISETGAVQYVLEGLGSTFEWIAGKLEHTQKRTEGLTNAFISAKPSADQIAKSIKEIGYAMDEMGRVQTRAQNAISDYGELLKTIYSGEDSTLEAQRTRMLSIVQFYESTDVITHRQAAAAKLAIDVQYEQERLRLKKQAMQDEAAIEKEAFDRNIAYEMKLQEELENVRGRKNNLDNRDKMLLEANEAEKRAQRYESEYQKAEQEVSLAGNTFGGAVTSGIIPGASKAALDRLKIAKERRDKAAKIAADKLAQVPKINDSREAVDANEKALIDALNPVVAKNVEDSERIRRNKIRRDVETKYATQATNNAIAQKAADAEAARVTEPYQDPRSLQPKFNPRTPAQARGMGQVIQGVQQRANATEAALYDDSKAAQMGDRTVNVMNRTGQIWENFFARTLALVEDQGARQNQINARLSRVEGWFRNGRRSQ